MAYSGSTAASSVANPPARVALGLLTQRSVDESTAVANGGSLWLYNSTNTTTNMFSPGFFTDGKNLGMRVGDIVICRCSSGEGSTHQRLVMGVLHSSNFSSGFAISSAGTITSTYG